MKWIKHQTGTRRDEKIARLMAAGGKDAMAAYGLYWMVQEIIADQMEGPEPACSVCYPVSVWSQLLVTRGSLVFSTLSTLAVTGLVTVTREGDDIRVTNRKLLKYRDEYSRKSGHAPENVRTRTDIDKEEDKERELKTKPLARSVPAEELAGTLPLVDQTLYEISKSQVSEWSQAYPAVDVRQELKKLKVWLDANPTRKKTRNGINRAIISWLSRAQDRAPTQGGSNGKGTYPSRSEQTVTALQAAISASRARRGDNGSSCEDGDLAECRSRSAIPPGNGGIIVEATTSPSPAGAR